MISPMQDEMQKLIAQDLGISDMSPEQQQELIGQFGAVALKAATVAIVEKLPEDKRPTFATLAQGGDPAALQAFLDAEVPAHEQIAKDAVAEEVKRFREFQKSA
jgi:hypothetical protein